MTTLQNMWVTKLYTFLISGCDDTQTCLQQDHRVYLQATLPPPLMFWFNNKATLHACAAEKCLHLLQKQHLTQLCQLYTVTFAAPANTFLFKPEHSIFPFILFKHIF
ncbi:hypothetical protein ATANTOWER_024562 [Ataeniobius toweri]|uniref:Uncharacterized protein n=1 Tax=Ataeniobius toweri TaxID=208326 RepID=A0ABU7BUN7_9TELE|nr:hypothetical protein [Ataeniobius toweri]